jgi:superoxide dismutase, Cu-Zn family
MKMTAAISLLAAATLAIGAVHAAHHGAAHTGATASFIDQESKDVGTATLTESPHGVLIHLDLKGLPPGPKAIHIHSVGTCEDPEEGFVASKGHLNPDGKEHGLMNPAGPDAGDLPNLYVRDDGSFEAEFFTRSPRWPGPTAADDPRRGRRRAGDPHQPRRPHHAADRRRRSAHRLRGHQGQMSRWRWSCPRPGRSPPCWQRAPLSLGSAKTCASIPHCWPTPASVRCCSGASTRRSLPMPVSQRPNPPSRAPAAAGLTKSASAGSSARCRSASWAWLTAASSRKSS